MQEQDRTRDDEGGAPGASLELLGSYLSFAKRAIRTRRLLSLTAFLVVFVFGIAGLAVWPRTYTSDLRLVVQSTGMLDPYDKSLNPLASAYDVITREDNREALVKQLELRKHWDATRAPPLKLKDNLFALVFGKPSEKDIDDALVVMLDSRLNVYSEGNALNISVDWPDPQIARKIATAAKDSFLEARHVEEISVIAEKMSILEGHASRVRGEIEGIARELGRLKTEKLAEIEKAARQVSQAAQVPSAAPAVAPAAPRRPAPPVTPPVMAQASDDLPKLKEEFSSKSGRLKEMQGRRSQNLLEAKGRLAELKFKYTDDHPEVRTTEQRVALLSRESPDESKLASEVQELEKRLERANANAKLEVLGARPRAGGSGATPQPNASEVLPSEILKLLDNSQELDPVVSAQLQTAIGKYGELRSEIRTARIQLDAAQAAFQHRYRIVAAASLPLKPSKPKVSLVLTVVLAAALLAGLLIPIFLELKTGVIVELWQVHQFRLPVLGELSLPPRER
jgi:uncharacterized protein involved in exopolysaccharide biosynthesis